MIVEFLFVTLPVSCPSSEKKKHHNIIGPAPLRIGFNTNQIPPRSSSPDVDIVMAVQPY